MDSKRLLESLGVFVLTEIIRDADHDGISPYGLFKKKKYPV